MSLSIKIGIASKGSNEPRRPFAAIAEALGRERGKSQAMMSLFIKALSKHSGAKLVFPLFHPPLFTGEVSRPWSATEGGNLLGALASSSQTSLATYPVDRGRGAFS